MEYSSLAQAIKESAVKYPEKTAIKIKDELLTYQELLEKSSQVANTLKKQGADQEAIGIVGQRHMASYVGILGALLAGCYYVPINPKFSKEKIISIINDSNIKFLVGDIDNFYKIKESLDDKTCNIILQKIIPFELAPESSGWLDRKYINSKNFKIDISNISKSELAYVMYTSGSTGAPKGVQVTNGNVLAYVSAVSSLWRPPKYFKMSQFHDLSFDPSVSDIFYTWLNGGALCVVSEQDMMLPSRFIIEEKIDIWSSVPSIGNFMMKMGVLNKNIFPDLKIIRFAGEPLHINIANAWRMAAPQSSVENHYGPTEATIDVSSFLYEGKNNSTNYNNDIVPIGKPMSGMKIAIIDNKLNQVKVGDTGELVYKGPQITKGYLNDESKTNSVFVQFDWDKSGDIWYKSGDLGFLNESGELECTGRIDNQIKLGGRRIEIGEVEAVLKNNKLLQDVVVVPIKNENELITGIAAFTMNKINKQEEILIRQESVQYLEKIFFPKKIITIAEFPRSPSGKIDRKVLSIKLKNL